MNRDFHEEDLPDYDCSQDDDYLPAPNWSDAALKRHEVKRRNILKDKLREIEAVAPNHVGCKRCGQMSAQLTRDKAPSREKLRVGHWVLRNRYRHPKTSAITYQWRRYDFTAFCCTGCYPPKGCPRCRHTTLLVLSDKWQYCAYCLRFEETRRFKEDALRRARPQYH